MSASRGKHFSRLDRGKNGAESTIDGARNAGNRLDFQKKALA